MCRLCGLCGLCGLKAVSFRRSVHILSSSPSSSVHLRSFVPFLSRYRYCWLLKILDSPTAVLVDPFNNRSTSIHRILYTIYCILYTVFTNRVHCTHCTPLDRMGQVVFEQAMRGAYEIYSSIEETFKTSLYPLYPLPLLSTPYLPSITT